MFFKFCQQNAGFIGGDRENFTSFRSYLNEAEKQVSTLSNVAPRQKTW